MGLILETKHSNHYFPNEHIFWKKSLMVFLFCLKKVNLMDEVLLNLHDHNSENTVGIGKNIRIVLPENASEGYSWQIDNKVPKEIELLYSDFKMTYKKALGGSGKRTVEFITKQAGVVNLKLIHYKFHNAKPVIDYRFNTRLIIK